MADNPETPGSSAKTAVAVGTGAIVGAMIGAPLIVAAAPVLLPAAAATAVIGGATAVAAGLGGIIGWAGFGKK